MYIWFTSYWEEPCLTSDLKQDYFKTNIHELICNPQILKKRATNLAKWTLKPITKRRSIYVRTRFGLVFSWDCKLHHTNAQTQWKVIKWKVIIEVYGKKILYSAKKSKASAWGVAMSNSREIIVMQNLLNKSMSHLNFKYFNRFSRRKEKLTSTLPAGLLPWVFPIL